MKANVRPTGPEGASDKALACIHCGLCLASCPTYLETGDENDSPRGRIYLMRAAREGRIAFGPTLVRHVDLCLGCRACEAVCPSAVAYGELLEQTREQIETRWRRSLGERWLRRVAIERLFPFPGRLRWAVRLAHWVQRLGAEAWLPRFARQALALVPADTSALTLPEISRSRTEVRRGRVGFLSGCVMSTLFGSTNAASVRLLTEAGYEVVTPRGQVCCGALYAHSGNLDRARACARRNLEVFAAIEVEAVITNAAGCGSTLKDYGRLLEAEPAWAERARAFSGQAKDLTEFLGAAGWEARPGQPAAAGGGRVTFHDACHLAHAQRITQAPRKLLQACAGAGLVELREADVCCGSAGSYNLTEPEMAQRLLRRKVETILATGADVVVTTNPGCLLQLQAGLRDAGAKHVRVVHLADYLAAWRE